MTRKALCVTLALHSMKTLQIQRIASGQYRYRITSADRVLVDWEFGPFDLDETIRQAKSRFSFDSVEYL